MKDTGRYLIDSKSQQNITEMEQTKNFLSRQPIFKKNSCHKQANKNVNFIQ